MAKAVADAAAAQTEVEAALVAARKAAAEGGIVRVHVKKVESHGRQGGRH